MSYYMYQRYFVLVDVFNVPSILFNVLHKHQAYNNFNRGYKHSKRLPLMDTWMMQLMQCNKPECSSTTGSSASCSSTPVRSKSLESASSMIISSGGKGESSGSSSESSGVASVSSWFSRIQLC